MSKYEIIVGLEIHIQLNTKSKMFCGCSADVFGKKPNTLTCPVCLGLPGALPVPNKKAVEKTQILSLALGCSLAEFSKFDRKNYFYPDLPKGYQISQYDQPLAVDGTLGGVRIRRVHLEEDTGKSIHRDKYTLLDFNKSGIPLVEIVTEPDIASAEQAEEFAREIRHIAKDLDVSDVDMEKGQLRLEPNISIRKRGESKFPDYKVEVKNINSFRFMKKAIRYEEQRQVKEMEAGNRLIQETRGWDEKREISVLQRAKEEEHDYRYFPEPDIPPMTFEKRYLRGLRRVLPRLSAQKSVDLVKRYNISEDEAKILTSDEKKLKFFEKLVELGFKAKKAAKAVINRPIILRDYTPKGYLDAITKIDKETISNEADIINVARKVIAKNKKAVSDYRSGKEAALQFLVGKIMQETKGRAKPKMVLDSVRKLLD